MQITVHLSYHITVGMLEQKFSLLHPVICRSLDLKPHWRFTESRDFYDDRHHRNALRLRTRHLEVINALKTNYSNDETLVQLANGDYISAEIRPAVVANRSTD